MLSEAWKKYSTASDEGDWGQKYGREAKDKTFENCDSEGADAGGGVGDDDKEENIRRRE